MDRLHYIIPLCFHISHIVTISGEALTKVIFLSYVFFKIKLSALFPMRSLEKSVQPLYHHLGIMPLLHINKYVVGRFMYRYCIGRVPDISSDFFKNNSEFYEYETRSADLFHIPPVSLDLGKTGIWYLGVIIWNSILKNGVNWEISEAIFAKWLKNWFTITAYLLPYDFGWFVPCSINVLSYQLML